jgi:RimJ/RimL family protein N-acetyltransferase
MRRLLNEPSWLEFIGDRGVRTEQDAREYLKNGALDSYERHGFGLWAVVVRGGESPVGICGLVKRDFLADVDLGFAFLPEFRGMGYAREAAVATLDLARRDFGLSASSRSPCRRIDARSRFSKHRVHVREDGESPGDKAEVFLYSHGS